MNIEVNTSLGNLSKFFNEWGMTCQPIFEIKLKAEIELQHKDIENKNTAIEESAHFLPNQCEEDVFQM